MILAIDFYHILSNLEDHVLTDKEIKSYIYALVNYLELNDYFKGVIIKSLNEKSLATYSFETLKIKMDTDFIKRVAVSEYEYARLKKIIKAFINLEILQAIYHEVSHIIHNYIAFGSDVPIGYLYRVDICALNDLDISDDDYDKIHNLMIIERDANINSLENILIIIKRYIKRPELFEYYLSKLQSFMLVGYEIKKSIVSPMEILYDGVYHLEVPSISNIDLYDKIKLGLPLKKKDMRTFTNNERNIILGKNNLQG